MKRLLFLFAVLIVTMGLQAQDRSVTLKTLDANVLKKRSVTWTYTGVTADTLTLTQDTLEVEILLNKSEAFDYYLQTVLDTVAGIDTTVIINVLGKMLADDTYTLLETTTTAVISGPITTTFESFTTPSFTMTIPAAIDSINTLASATPEAERIASYNAVARVITISPLILKSYKYLKLQYVIAGDDSVGEGVSLTSIAGSIQKSRY